MERINPACEDTRQALQGAEAWFWRLTELPLPEDDNYEEQQELLSSVLTAAYHDVFMRKPEGCEMKAGDDDFYECERCDFECHITADEG